MKKMKILALTGARSDYDLLSKLFIKLQKDPDIEFGLLVSGSHLSERFGYSVQNIQADGLNIVAQIDSLIDSPSPSARIKSLAILLQCCLHSVVAFAPDVILFSGDREDVIAGGILSNYLGIPGLHIFGGDHGKDGHMDHAIRHAASKLASVHIVSTEFHKNRLLAMGESEERIHVIGSPALDKLRETEHWTKEFTLEKLNIPYLNEYAILIYHPVHERQELNEQDFTTIVECLQEKKIPILISLPNADSQSHHVLRAIEKLSNSPGIYFYKNLERTHFVNLLRHSKFLIGNSSMGLVEAPFIKLPAINVGIRQTGRFASKNVIFCDNDKNNIINALEKLFSEEFLKEMKTFSDSPYGDGFSVERAYQLIKTIKFSSFLDKTKDDPLELNCSN